MPRLTRLWQSATPLGRFAFVVAVLASTLYAGTKTNDVGSAGNSGTNRLMYVLRRLMPSDVIQPAVTPSNAVEVANLRAVLRQGLSPRTPTLNPVNRVVRDLSEKEINQD